MNSLNFPFVKISCRTVSSGKNGRIERRFELEAHKIISVSSYLHYSFRPEVIKIVIYNIANFLLILLMILLLDINGKKGNRQRRH